MSTPKPVTTPSTDPEEQDPPPPTDTDPREVSDDQLDQALEETFPASDPISP